jgi:hypothetical protein
MASFRKIVIRGPLGRDEQHDSEPAGGDEQEVNQGAQGSSSDRIVGRSAPMLQTEISRV